MQTLAERDVGMVATTFVDNAGITRVKSVPLSRLPQLAAWGVGASTSFDYFRFDDWLAAPEGGTAPVGDLRVIPDLRRVVPLAAQPGWAWTPGDRYRQDGEPHERCNRLALQRLVEDAAADGLEIKAAIEIEWVVSAGDGDDFVSAAVGPAYGMTRLINVSDYARDVIAALSAEGIAVEQFHPEYAAGQLELSVAAESPSTPPTRPCWYAAPSARSGGATTTAPRSHPRWTPRASATAVMCISACGGTARI